MKYNFISVITVFLYRSLIWVLVISSMFLLNIFYLFSRLDMIDMIIPLDRKIRTTWIFFGFFFFFLLFGAAPAAYGGSQTRGQIVELELQLPAYTTATAMPDLSCIGDLHHSSQQHQIHNPLSEAKDQTRNLMAPSRICFRYATMGTHDGNFSSNAPSTRLCPLHYLRLQPNPLRLPCPHQTPAHQGWHRIFFFFLWTYWWHMDVPRLGVKSQSQFQPMPQLWQHWILNPTEQCQGLNTHPLRDNIGSLTRWAQQKLLT